MKKKVAVLAVNPVNGIGLFTYLEQLYENGIEFQVFAVSTETKIKTNSGIYLETDDRIGNLKNREQNFDAMFFACGNAMPEFVNKIDEIYNRDMLAVIENFAKAQKIIVGHCASALLFNQTKALYGKRVALHPMIKNYVPNLLVSDKSFEIDGKLFTAKNEICITELMPFVINALKE
ncbi:MAG: DJ-1/PfpI family protein [Bacteroidales bacterium]|jgi:putative intracellular protease/amidase|nr:DJ-1/PfpI family protein [Bacteroidales bacterium]